MTKASRVGRRGHSVAFRASVVAAMAAGGQVRRVAQLYGVSTASVYLWCKAAGVQSSPEIGKPPSCHPAEAHYGRGLCRRGYRWEWERNGFDEGKGRKGA